MAKKQEIISNDRVLTIILPEGSEPQITFKGVWNVQLVERMMRKSFKELRQHKIRLAQEAEKAKGVSEKTEINVDR